MGADGFLPFATTVSESTQSISSTFSEFFGGCTVCSIRAQVLVSRSARLRWRVWEAESGLNPRPRPAPHFIFGFRKEIMANEETSKAQPTTARQVRVFLAEDNAADVWLVEEALRRQSIDFCLDVYSTAEDAVNAALACGKGDALVPDVMLVDFNLPRGDGLEILAAAASNPNLDRD